MNPPPVHPNASRIRRGALALLAWLSAASALGAPESIAVTLDDNYPPYVFRGADGKLQGILPDEWALWEKKTGVKVRLQAMDWAESQRVMREGRADVIDTIFLTEDRAKLYDFTPPYAQIEVPVFAHETLGGIVDVSSLKGFTIGVKAGDAVIEHLARRGIDSLKEYPSYEAIVLAAKNQEIKIFSVDKPAAVYFMYKHGIAGHFNEAMVLYTGEFHRAVGKNRPDLLNLVQTGFNRISKREYRAIERKWMGSPFLFSEILCQWKPWILGGAALILLLVGGNVLLSRRVRAKTSELRRSLGELRTSEEKLRISHEYFAAVFDGINEALFIHDAETGDILDVNRRTLEMYGYSTREEITAVHLGMLSAGPPPYSLEDALEWIRKARTEGPQVFEWNARHKDGHCFMVEISIRHAQIGSDRRMVVSVRDISDRKAAEEKRLNVERRLQEAQKLESLALLAGGVAHDFNNLLTAILGNVDLALLDLPQSSPARADLLTAMTATHRAAGLAQQMLAFSGKGRFAVESMHVPDVVHEIAQILRVSISKNADLRLHFPDALPAIEADASQLRQVVMNLVLNASEALDNQPGTIDVSAGVVEGSSLPPSRLWPHEKLADGPYLFIEVADTGSGIPPDILEKIFDPFFSTKFTGRGLGLAAVLGILRSHKGAIQVDSAPGQGTNFRVFFPVQSDAPAPAPAAPRPAAAAADGGLILLVDDEASLRETASKLLARMGFQVLCAADGEQAVNLFRAQSARICGVILDLTLPKLDGVQTFSALRSIRADVPVLVSSGYSQADVRQRFAGLQINGFIPKPYTLDGLRQTLDQALRP
ncbi:MAG: transporter substrate-binding domain-containing protein [Kiritimatiellia bacterium]